MRILVACEESQAVARRLRELNHEAYSCDLLPCSGGHDEYHLQVDATQLLKMHWDMVIAFPPCTHLAVSGATHFEKKREDGRQREGIELFSQFLNTKCSKVAVENPVNIISGDYIQKWFPDLCEKYNLPRKPAQFVQPYEYGDHARKKTCFWLKGLDPLVPTNVVDPGEITSSGHSVGASSDTARDERGKALRWNDPRTGIIRSKTFPGIAQAIADQWAGPNRMIHMTQQKQEKLEDCLKRFEKSEKILESPPEKFDVIDFARRNINPIIEDLKKLVTDMSPPE